MRRSAMPSRVTPKSQAAGTTSERMPIPSTMALTAVWEYPTGSARLAPSTRRPIK